MSTTSKIDTSTLGWIKTEIDESLKQAHIALESFVENRSDDTRLRFCVTHLHQVVGTLQMVELDGAAMLAREAERLAAAILNEEVEASDNAFELLTRAMVFLPDYLGGLQIGRPDTPVRLLPIINEFRSARHLEPVAEDELFTPDLSVRPPPRPQDQPKPNEAEYSALTQRLRPSFQAALLNWLRDNNDAKALATISETVEELEKKAPIGVVEQLFWVAGALLETLVSGDLEPINDRKKLVARLDQQLKKLIDGTEKSVLRNTSEALVKSMLFQLGRAKSDGPKVTQLKRAFELDLLLGGPVDDGSRVAGLPEPDTIQSVSMALGEETQQAQELLAAFFDPDQEDVDSLEPLLELLRKMSGTMDLLGIPTLKQLVDQLREVAAAVVDGSLELSDEVSMRMAHALLLIENCSRDIWAPTWKKQIEDWIRALHGLLSRDDSVPDATGIEVSEVTETEFGELVGVVAEEIRVSLTKVEEALEEFAADTDDKTHLDEVPQHMNQIHGALQILGEDRALQLAEVVTQRVDEVRSDALVRGPAVLDALAVCVGTLSAYAEGLQHGGVNIDDLMDAALNDMDTAVRMGQLGDVDPVVLVDTIQQDLSRWLVDTGSREGVHTLRENLEAIATLANSQGQERIERISMETNTLLSIVGEDPGQLSDEIGQTLNRSVEALSKLVRQNMGGGIAPTPARVTSVPPSTVASEHIVQQQAAPTEEALIATPATEPPAVEPTPTPAAPEPPPVQENIETAAAAQATPAPETSPASTPTPPAQMDTELDAEMLEIFIDEAREVLETINTEFPTWRSAPENTNALAEVRRGFHTLKGSGRMVGAFDIGELAWAVENLLNKARDGKIAHSDAIFDTVAEGKDVLPAMIDQLEGGPAPTTDIEELRQRAHALANGESPPVSKAATGKAAPAPSQAEETVPTEEAFPELEPTLLRIFTGEAQGHLDTIEQEIAACRQSGGGCLVSEPLLRATHTLLGSSRSVGLRPMSETCGEMEQLLEAMEETRIPLEEPHLTLLTALVDCINALIAVLNDDAKPTSDVRDRFQDLCNRVRQEIAQLPTVDATEETTAEARVTQVPEAPSKPTQAATVPDQRAAGPVPAPAQPARDTQPRAAGIEEDIDPELVDVFLEEAADLLGSIEEALRHWRANHGDAQAVEDIKRALHTLKGGARMASAISVGNLAHDTEDLVKRVEEEKIKLSAEVFDLLDEVHDTLVTLLDQIRQARPLSSVQGLHEKIARAVAAKPIAEVRDTAAAAAQADRPKAASVEPMATAQPWAAVASTQGEDDAAAAYADRRGLGDTEPEQARQRRDRRGQVRVRTSVLTDLVNYAGEVSISRARMEQQVHGFRDNLTELNRNVIRFRDQLRELEIQSESQILYTTGQAGESESSSGFDPLELDRYSRLQQLSRSLTESLHDLSAIQSGLHTFAGEAETVLQQQARINTSLQEGLMHTRMIAFSTQGARLRHIARQTSRELGKRVELRITGTNVDVDRNVLERMMGPFEHMIRNSLDHGIESEQERRRAGKPLVGTITIDTRQEGTEIAIRFSDDGAGLDIEAIRRRAIENGLTSEDKVLSDEELIQFILVAGFSTAHEVTHLSGRGVGMDVVENEVKQLGGSMAVSTTPGQGTTFTIHLPVTLSITQALFVHVGEQTFAVPLSAVVNIIEVPVDKMNVSMGKNPLLNYEDKVYSFMNVGKRLGMPSGPRNGGKVPVLLAKIGTREVAVQVDGLGGTKEIVVKSLGPQLSELKGLAGATILGDGRVLLILNIGGLWLTDEALHVEYVAQAAPAEKTKRRPVVMVVDDSLTVRKITGRHLQKRGLDVLTAKDGVDALEQLQGHVTDVMLVDIEMPRMDGYELTTRVRSDPRFKHIPIIIITSRAGEKHRKRAFELGVDLYLSKPYTEDELFKNVNSLLPQATVH